MTVRHTSSFQIVDTKKKITNASLEPGIYYVKKKQFLEHLLSPFDFDRNETLCIFSP